MWSVGPWFSHRAAACFTRTHLCQLLLRTASFGRTGCRLITQHRWGGETVRPGDTRRSWHGQSWPKNLRCFYWLLKNPTDPWNIPSGHHLWGHHWPRISQRCCVFFLFSMPQNHLSSWKFNVFDPPNTYNKTWLRKCFLSHRATPSYHPWNHGIFRAWATALMEIGHASQVRAMSVPHCWPMSRSICSGPMVRNIFLWFTSQDSYRNCWGKKWKRIWKIYGKHYQIYQNSRGTAMMAIYPLAIMAMEIHRIVVVMISWYPRSSIAPCSIAAKWCAFQFRNLIPQFAADKNLHCWREVVVTKKRKRASGGSQS